MLLQLKADDEQGAEQICGHLFPSHIQLSRIAEAVMRRKFAAYTWRQLGVFLTPTLVKSLTPATSARLMAARARRGGSFAGRGRGNSDTRDILRRLVRYDEKEVEEEGNSDSDHSVSSDLGPIFNVIL